MFSQKLLGEIRDRLPISMLIGERIPLKKAGRNLKGLCPFHNEKTPSFTVSDDKQMYHCFGCGEGGDIFSFVMKYDSMGFAEAVKMLAQRCGVVIPADELRDKNDNAEATRKKKWCLRVNEIAATWFASRLSNEATGGIARNYLISRGIKNEIWTQLNLGYADKSWDALTTHLAGRGVPLEIAAELGLVKKRPAGEGYYDFFRGRLIFPITSPRGEIIAFGGRTIDGDDEAKYLNSPDSTIFHKSMSVYGLAQAAEHIRRADRVIIVEGYMDVIGLVQADVRNVVAPLGTALTSGHIRLLARTTRSMTLSFDGDDAGIRAALRTLPAFIELGIMPRVVLLPKGEDPDSFVRTEGASAFMTLVDNAVSLFDFFLDRTIAHRGRDTAGAVNAMSDVVPLIKQMGDPTERAVYGQRVAERLGVAPSIVHEAVNGDMPRAQAKARTANASRAVLVPSAERTIVELMVQVPRLAPHALAEVAPDDFSDGFCRMIAEMLSGALASHGTIVVSDILAELADPDIERELRAISLAADQIDEDEAQQALSDCIRAIHLQSKRRRLRELNELIRSAEAHGDTERLYELLRRKEELARERHITAAT